MARCAAGCSGGGSCNCVLVSSDSVSVSGSGSAADPFSLSVGSEAAALRGRLVSVGGFTSASPSSLSFTGTTRVPFFVVTDATDLRVSFVHRYNVGASNFADATPASNLVGVKASLEIAGTIYPLTVGGKVVFDVQAGGMVETDPLPVEVAAGSVVYVRSFMPSGMVWYFNHYTGTLAAGSGGFVATTDLTAQGSGPVADGSFLNLWTAQSITGTHLNGRKPVALIVGDSIANGVTDAQIAASYIGVNVVTPNLAGGGYLVRACRAAGIPVANAGVSADLASTFAVPISRWYRTQIAPDVSNVLCEYGRNDVSSGDSPTAIETNLIKVWRLFSDRGIKVFQPTITPFTTSTDGWTTTTQTPAGNEANRVALNGWLRDGAPLNSTTFVPVATNTSPPGTIRAGAAGHPLAAYFEVTDWVETARNSGIWVAPSNLRSVPGASTTLNGTAVTSAAPQFSSADVGRKVVVPGAGTAGALYIGLVTAFNNTQSVAVWPPTATAVGPVAISVSDNNTADGLHPGSYLHQVMAAAVPTGQMVP